MPPDAPQHPPAPKAKCVTLGKRLARLKRRWVATLSGAPPPAATPSQDHASWASILTGEREQSCPAQEFRLVSFNLRKTGNLSEAEKICTRGVAIHPSDLPLAIEHAEIAKAAKDPHAAAPRWQKVVDLAGNDAPLSAFRNLADCQRTRAAFDQAEITLRRGLAIHPGEFQLTERLAGILFASGNPAKAIIALRTLIAAHPDHDLAPAYLRLSLALREEGLLERAEAALHEGLGKYPDDSKLRNSLAELSFHREKPSKLLKVSKPDSTFTAHLFQDRCAPFGQGVLGFSTGTSAFRQHVPAMLDFAEIVSPLDEPARVSSIDVFAIWGVPSSKTASVRDLAASLGKPLLCLDSGFLSTPGIEGKDAPAQSVIICPDRIYLDATQPSPVENTLNSDDYALTDDQQARARTCIASIISSRVSKYNHAPRINLHPRFPADGTKRILLVDQKFAGATIHYSLGGPGTFERMWEAALALPDHEILVKLHPEVISGRYCSHLRPLLPDPLPQNVTLIDFDVNPFDLFDVVDQVFVCTSQLGFEAVMAGKEVHCFGAPFYSGWGFTQDRIAIPRRKKRRTPAEVFHLFYIVHSRYFVPGRTGAEIEDLITHLATVRDNPPAVAENAAPPPPARDPNEPLKILMVIPSARYGATGRYLQHLSVSLIHLGCEVMVLAEGPCQRLEAGVRWLTLEFDGLRLAEPLRREITEFAPHFIYENGVRSRAQRAALEAVALTGARFAMQSEDDDIQVHRHHRSEQAAAHLGALDRPTLTTAEIAGFLKTHDWNHSLHALLDPRFDRWVEPILRILCYRMACVHTAIWHPFARRLAREYAVPTLVVPPVACAADFERIPLTSQERATVLQRHHIDPAATVIFIGGALYPYSNEFAVFLTALDLAARQSAAKFALVVTSDRTSLPLGRMAAERLVSAVTFADIGVATDAVYMEMLKACDIVCSPGLPDDFNRYRLPSRLVKAMAMAKPILTCRCGFGESLDHHGNAFLMDGEDPASWAAVIALTHDPAIRTQIGERGRDFAREHFDAHRVAAALKQQFELSLCRPPRTLAAGITVTGDQEIRPHPSIRLQNLNNSPLQPAIHALALRTHRLDTVVHIGTDNCGEWEDYCRLGVRQIVIVATTRPATDRLESLANLARTIKIMDLETAMATVIPTADEACHLLAVKTGIDRDNLLQTTPAEALRHFRWIVAPTGNSAESALESAGFRTIPLPGNHPTGARHLLFERTTPKPSLSW